jgi:ABC-type transport system involved in multi-copper enzyme maturation permease subunit
MVIFFAFSEFSVREDLTITKSTGLGIITLAGVFISVILGINLIPNEIDKRTIYTILSKPVRRHEFLIGKFLGGLITVLTNTVLMGAVFIVGVWIKQKNPEWAIWEGVLMTFFQLMLLNALALLFSVFVSPFVNFFLTFFIYIVGSMSSVTESLATPDPHKSPFVVYLFKFIHSAIPNFGNFNIQNPLIYPGTVVINMTQYIVQNMMYAITYTAILMLIAILIFDKREV